VGAVVAGPAVIREPLSTTFVMPGQAAEIGRFGEIVIERRATTGSSSPAIPRRTRRA
jgi:hypothetical protein